LIFKNCQYTELNKIVLLCGKAIFYSSVDSLGSEVVRQMVAKQAQVKITGLI